MHEEPQHGVRDRFAHEFGNKQKMVVVYPDKIPRLVDIRNSPCECSIRRLIIGIMAVGRSILSGNVLPQKIVEQWPES